MSIEVIRQDFQIEVPAIEFPAYTVVAIKGDKGDKGEQGLKGDTDLSAINSHIASATPHPTYDDLPSLSLQFENGLI